MNSWPAASQPHPARAWPRDRHQRATTTAQASRDTANASADSVVYSGGRTPWYPVLRIAQGLETADPVCWVRLMTVAASAIRQVTAITPRCHAGRRPGAIMSGTSGTRKVPGTKAHPPAYARTSHSGRPPSRAASRPYWIPNAAIPEPTA